MNITYTYMPIGQALTTHACKHTRVRAMNASLTRVTHGVHP